MPGYHRSLPSGLSYCVEYGKIEKTTPPVRSAPCREARVSYFLTQDEFRHVFKGIRSKRTTIYARLTAATLEAQARKVFATHRVVNYLSVWEEPLRMKNRKRHSALCPNHIAGVSAGCVTLCAVLALMPLPTVVFAQASCPGIHVQILHIRNSAGTVDCALFDSPEGFPTEVLRSAPNVMIIKVRKTQARCDFEEILPGTYALAVLHDENMNGKLDTNARGSPTEGYSFSNDVKGLFGAPAFSAASFAYDGRARELTIGLQY